jgi:hypothetical protein
LGRFWIDARIKELSDWRGETLARVRMLILDGKVLKALIRAAVALNTSSAAQRP